MKAIDKVNELVEGSAEWHRAQLKEKLEQRAFGVSRTFEEYKNPHISSNVIRQCLDMHRYGLEYEQALETCVLALADMADDLYKDKLERAMIEPSSPIFLSK